MILDNEYNLDELKELSSEELNTILNRELEKSDPDGRLMANVVRILESRESKDMEMPEGAKVACAVAWNQHQENCEKIDRAWTKKSTAKSSGWLSRVAVIAAVLSIAVFAVPHVAGAENIFALVGRWTQCIFEFFDSEDDDPIQAAYVFETDNPDLQRIYDAVCDIGVTQPVVPMWVPEGYEFEELKTTETPAKKKVYVVLKHGDKSIVMTISHCDQGGGEQYYKDGNDILTVDLHGVVHYIMSNDGAKAAVWTTKATECSLSITDEEDVLIRMLKSIYNAEE